LSIALGLNTLFFIAREVKSLKFLIISTDTHLFYFLYFALAVCVSGTLLFYATGFPWKDWLVKKLLVVFPSFVLLAFALVQSKHFHYVFQVATGLYVIIAGLFLVSLRHTMTHPKHDSLETTRSTDKVWFMRQKKSTLAILILLIFINLGFGTYRIAQYAAVDEALWTFGGRISKYWNNIADRDWNGTRVSDKPGVTVSIISGTGLLFETPMDYKSIKWENGGTSHPKNDIQKLNFALRFPILLFTVFMLPVLYFFLERLFGERKALISTILIGTSPVLLGMSRIINPDSLLWIFSSLSLVSYFIFLKRRFFTYLYWSGIFLGLALLTKYVANILFIFFFGLIFLEYILMERKTRNSIDFIAYIKTAFLDYFVLTFVALAVFYIIYPAVWVRPTRLLDATLLSQAFSGTWPLFIGIISFILIDQWTMKNRITKALLDTIADKKHWLITAITAIFLLSVLFVCANTLSGMHWYDFEEILSSPKTSYTDVGFTGVFLGNFYPLVFSIHAITFLSLIFFSVFLIRHSTSTSYSYRSGLYLILFILIYYLGSAVNHVATISRYQIMIFPIAFILASIPLSIAFETLRKKISAHITSDISAFALLIIMTLPLIDSAPLYSGYNSILLPKTYHTNVKDMGDGSYEAANALNQLPDATNITIWTDKSGVCTFFVGNCYSSFNYNNLKTKGIDYVVVSSGRQSRTTKMVQGAVAGLKPNVIRFDQYYDQTDNLTYALYIDDRPGNFVKILPFKAQ
jgi:hypothetical protein